MGTPPAGPPATGDPILRPVFDGHIKKNQMKTRNSLVGAALIILQASQRKTKEANLKLHKG